MSKRRRGFPSEPQVKRGERVVHGDKLLEEKRGRKTIRAHVGAASGSSGVALRELFSSVLRQNALRSLIRRRLLGELSPRS